MVAGGQHLPVILIEVVLVFGGVLAFGWWQLRSVKRDQQRAKQDLVKPQPQPAADASASVPPAAGAPPVGSSHAP